MKKVKSIPNIGGRNFDLAIINECLKKYSEEQKSQLTYKSKFRLLEAVEAARKKLTVNNDISIVVESFYKDNDLEYYLTKEKFEKIIKNELNIIENSFIEFSCEIYKEFFPENLTIEMAGEIMRTPILQKIIESVWNEQFPISKGILIDECTSIGAALYGYFTNVGVLPMKHFKKIYEYNNYQILSIINRDFSTKKCIRKCDCNEDLQSIKINIENLNDINLRYYYDGNQIKYISNQNLLFENKIHIDKNKKMINTLYVNHHVKENQLNYNIIGAYVFKNSNKDEEIRNKYEISQEKIELVNGFLLNENKINEKKMRFKINIYLIKILIQFIMIIQLKEMNYQKKFIN